MPGSRSYPIAIASSSRSSRIASFSSNAKADDSARVCRLCLRQAACSSDDHEFREAGLFRFFLLTLLRFAIVLLVVLVIDASEDNFDHDQEHEHEHEKSEQAPFETILLSLSRSVPNGRIRFTFELVNERRCLTQPFESLLGGEPVKLGVAVEILGRALSQSALEFLAR